MHIEGHAGGVGHEPIAVTLQRTATTATEDQFLWVFIRNRTAAISFNNYKTFLDRVMCGPTSQLEGVEANLAKDWRKAGLRFHGVAAYDLLKTSTEAFLMHECGHLGTDEWNGLDVADEESRLGYAVTEQELQVKRTNYLEDLSQEFGQAMVTLPYFKLILGSLANLPLKPGARASEVCYGILPSRLSDPCFIELIWSYWHEQMMLVQTMNSLSLRFQNVRRGSARDPLANLEIDPLRPLNNLLWGYIQDESHRTSVVRRTYEYSHHYGLTLEGKAVPKLRPADHRSKFIEAFHTLLHICTHFFKTSDDVTVVPDGFPVLNALKEVHLLLAQGAHNQYGDLPWTARIEMLIMQWLLARPEMREFLGGRVMVPYPEPWMDRVDTMKTLQGWSDTSVQHFYNLAVFGEQLLLAIRFGNWSTANDPAQGANWAQYWRPEIQGYTHAYRAVTGADLTQTADSTQPSAHLRRRVAERA